MTQDEALRLFEYRDGQLYWRIKPSRRDPIGMVAGSQDRSRGYVAVTRNRKHYYAHQIVFLMHHGVIPLEVDHINGDKSDNRVENLRVCTRAQNMHNRPAQRNNKSGARNVSWSPARKKWCVFLTANRKTMNLGGYEDFELADLVAAEARDKYHGAFANHGGR